uniref:Uncharacterized protein n=1 Tax=Meloidogyne enterolobii TaxID=390850 RepID=A0A6V7UD70_MELEN|nr:unnamed protein product [Meloidogyne enterolobii]
MKNTIILLLVLILFCYYLDCQVPDLCCPDNCCSGPDIIPSNTINISPLRI